MSTYLIPRNTKGENRILLIFSTKALIYTAIGASIGFLFYLLFNSISIGFVGIILIVLFGLTGFVIGTLKMPKIEKFKFTKQTSGEKIDDIILRTFRFYKNKKRIYIYREDFNNGKRSNH
jgi:hypothetical protein